MRTAPAWAQELEHYALEDRLGEGGMAEVYRVRHRRLGTLHALKVLRLQHPALEARLLREGRLQGRVRHPNVVAVTDRVRLGDRLGLVMELVQGPTLGAFLTRSHPTLPQRDALARGLLAGVAAAHAAGLVHRDLKPANVLLQPHADRVVPRVSDFGIARLLDGGDEGEAPLTHTGLTLGTPAYMAPEQIRDARSVDARADLWSLGCVLYELVTGARAFDGPDHLELLQAVAAGRYTPPEALNPAAPRRWCRAIAAALAVDPADRAPDCATLAAIWGALPAVGPRWPPEALAALRQPVDRPPSTGSDTWLGEGSLAEDTLGTLDRARETPADALWDNLPRERDPFVGRGSDLAALGERLVSGALVTVLGPAGVGKTRLALRAARAARGDWPGGVLFCDLSHARSPEAICAAAAAALGARPGRDPAESVAAALAGRGRCLLVLDNLEQAAEHLQGTVDLWAARAPEAGLLATSRVVLGLPGEQLFLLGPLPAAEAALLFELRASAARRGFSLEGGDREAVTALVAQLDGLPLAIELAAARTRSLSPTQLRRRLAAPLRVLGPLRAAIADSWAMLEGWQQGALAQASVFEGSFNLEAAEAVLLPEGPGDSWWAMDAVQDLVDQSLLSAEVARGEARYRLLSSVRAFAAEQLSPPDRAAAEARHAAHFARRGREKPRRPLPERLQELPDLAAAAQRAAAAGEALTAARCVQSAALVYSSRGPTSAGLALLVAVKEALASPPPEAVGILAMCRGMLQATAGQLEAAEASQRAAAAAFAAAGWEGSRGVAGFYLGRVLRERGQLAEAESVLLEARALLEAEGRDFSVASVLEQLGLLALRAGRRAEGRAQIEESLRLRQALGDALAAGGSLGLLATLDTEEGHTEDALRRYRAALEIFQEIGARHDEASVLSNLGGQLWMGGQLEEAEALMTQALALHRAVGNRSTAATTLGNLGKMHIQQGRLALAEERLEAALAEHRAMGVRYPIGYWLSGLSGLARARGDGEAASRLAREAIEAAEGYPLFVGEFSLDLARARMMCGDLEEAGAALEVAAGVFGEGAPAPMRAWRLVVEGELALAAGERERARVVLAEAEVVCPREGRSGTLQADLEALAERLR
jgi:predicted ATPase